MGQRWKNEFYRDPERAKKFHVGQEVYFCPDCKTQHVELLPLVNYYVHGVITDITSRAQAAVKPVGFDGEVYYLCDPQTFEILAVEETATMDPRDTGDVILCTALQRRQRWGEVPTAIGEYILKNNGKPYQGILDKQCQDDPVVIYIPRMDREFHRILPEREDTFMEGTIVAFTDGYTSAWTTYPCKSGDQTGSPSPSVEQSFEPYCIARHIYEALRLHPEWIELYLEGARLDEDGRNFKRGAAAYAELLRQSFDYIPAPVIPFDN